jgi:uncharacterized protein (DUF2384 family)
MSTLIDRVHAKTSSRLDAGPVAALYGLKLAKLARIAKLNPETLRKKPDAPSAQKALAKLVNAWEILRTIFVDDEAISRWLHHPIPSLKGLTPLGLLEQYGIDSFEGLAEEMAAGSYG